MQLEPFADDSPKDLERCGSLIRAQMSAVHPGEALASVHMECVGVDSPSLFNRLIEFCKRSGDMLRGQRIVR
jgi:hypothetical protein